jgi:pilus assembly protein CpaC
VGEWSLTDLLNVFAFRPDLNLGAFIQDLQSQRVLQILAEPNLVTTNGKEASFLVGGEFPVPVLQGGANSGAVTIQFREFGIRLTFNPLITENKTIKMYVKPEVSTIDLANAVTFNGFTIPALSTRRMDTNIELGEGQSFVIGGLLDDRVNDSLSRMPGLASIPVLGALFKSRADNKTKTELIVMVTPEITTPLTATDPKPIPVMPREFLPPTSPPNPHGGAAKDGKGSKKSKT